MRLSGYFNKRKKTFEWQFGTLEDIHAFAESKSSEAISSIMANFEMAKNICLQTFFCHFNFGHNKYLVLFFYPFEEQCFRLQSVTPISRVFLFRQLCKCQIFCQIFNC